MRTLDAQFELFNVAHVSGWGWGREDASRFGTARLVEIRRRVSAEHILDFRYYTSCAPQRPFPPILVSGFHLRGATLGIATLRPVPSGKGLCPAPCGAFFFAVVCNIDSAKVRDAFEAE